MHNITITNYLERKRITTKYLRLSSLCRLASIWAAQDHVPNPITTVDCKIGMIGCLLFSFLTTAESRVWIYFHVNFESYKQQKTMKKKNSFENGGWMAPLYFVPRSPFRLSLVSVHIRNRWVFVGASIIPQVNAILYSLLLFDERAEGLYNQGISNVFGYFPSSWFKCRYRNQLEFTRRVTCSLQLLF